MTYEIQKLKENHQRIIDMVLDGMGNKEIAEKLGMTPTGVGLIRRSPVFQGELERRSNSIQEKIEAEVVQTRVDAGTRITEAATRAAEVQIELLDSESEIVRQKSAMDILDRAGYGKTSKMDVTSRSVTISLVKEDFSRILEAAQETGSQNTINAMKDFNA